MIPLREAFELAAFGGKAVQLGEALRAGLPVPDGFAVSADQVEAVAHGDTRALGQLERIAASLRGSVAVRSSAVGEDSAGASFAGQHATVLHVEPNAAAIATAMRTVWESGRTVSALAYRRRLGVDGLPKTGVAIQHMVDSDCAGVLFSRDPLSGEDVRVVEAAWGLGEAVVAGLVTPDRFRVSRSGEILERTAGFKDLRIRRSATGGTEEVPVDESKAGALCLSDAQLLALHALAGLCETTYGGGQDIEWAFAGGALFLLQRRPITRAGTPE